MSFKIRILILGLAVTFIPVNTVFAEDSEDFVACQQIKPRGEFTPMKEKKNCFRDLAKETARQYNELLKQPSAHSTVFAEDSEDFVACQQIKPRGEFTPMKEKKNCFRDLAKETARQYNELLKQPSVHVAEPRERRSTGDKGEVAVDESGAALLTCPGEILLYIPSIIYAQEAISGNNQQIDVIDLCSTEIERWQLSDAICDYAELPIETSDGAKFCFNSAIQDRTKWCTQWGDTIDINKCWGTRHQYTPTTSVSSATKFLVDKDGELTASTSITDLCTQVLRMTNALMTMGGGKEPMGSTECMTVAMKCVDEVAIANPEHEESVSAIRYGTFHPATLIMFQALKEDYRLCHSG